MDKLSAIEILSKLILGIDSNTGEKFPDDSPYNDINTIRALHYAIMELSKKRVKDVKHKTEPNEYIFTSTQEELFKILMEWRNVQVKKFKKPSCYIQESSIKKIVKYGVRDIDNIKYINGMGIFRVRKFGQEIIRIIDKFHNGIIEDIVSGSIELEPKKEPIAKLFVKKSAHLLPENAGKDWTTTEEKEVLEAFTSGVTILQIANNHKRTEGSIQSRLMKLGKI